MGFYAAKVCTLHFLDKESPLCSDPVMKWNIEIEPNGIDIYIYMCVCVCVCVCVWTG